MRRLLASCFGLGWLPVAPGTWGSLPVVVIFGLLSSMGASVEKTAFTMAAMALVGCAICVKFAPAAIAATGTSDPGEVVADEFAGQAVTFLLACTAPASNVWFTVIVGFVLFRFFDILKPWPIRKLEKLPGAWGILADDLMAGVYAGIMLVLSLRFLIPCCVGRV